METLYGTCEIEGSCKQPVTMNKKGMAMRTPRAEEGRARNYVNQGSLSDSRLGS